MQFVNCSFDTPEENLACDEVLLARCESGDMGESLRVWESPRPFVVAGYANHTADDVHWKACRRFGIPIFRRISGGGSVLQGPGCLNFSLVLQMTGEKELATVTGTNRYVAGRIVAALKSCIHLPLAMRGLSDLALHDRKVSGSAQRRARKSVLLHGTLLLDFDIPLIERTLGMPRREPDYRKGRGHEQFLRNMPASHQVISQALRQEWNAEETASLPVETIWRLAKDKYSSSHWHLA